MNLTNEENIFNRLFNRIGDLILLNMLFILCSIPIITIGASFAALNYSCMKIIKEGDVFERRMFFEAFKENFKQATAVWLGYLIIIGVLLCNLRFLNTIDNPLSQILTYLSLFLFAIITITALYLFPSIATFKNKTSNLIRNSCIFAMGNMGTTVGLLLIWGLLISLLINDSDMFHIYIFCWLTFGVSLLTYGSTQLMYRIFKKYI